MATVVSDRDVRAPLGRARARQRRRSNATTKKATKKTTRARTRVQLDFGGEAFKRVEEIRELGGFESIPELLRQSLRLTEWYLHKRQAGYNVLVEKDNERLALELL
jgi:hypothetical protein